MYTLVALLAKTDPFFLGPKPGHRLPWSQVLREKLAPLSVGHTHRMPYLLFALPIASSNHLRSAPITNTQPPKYPGRYWTSHLFYPIKVLGWLPPGLNQVEPVTLGAKMLSTRP